MASAITEATEFQRPQNSTAGFLPEGPRFFEISGRPTLCWVNIQTASDSTTGEIWFRDWQTGETYCHQLPGRPGFVIPTTVDEELLVGLTKEIGYYNVRTHQWSPVATIPDDHPRTIINDAEVTPDGCYVIFGTKDTAFREPIGHLYLFDDQSELITVLANQQTCSNGKVLHLATNGYKLFDIDTPTRQISEYFLEVNPPRLSAKRVALNLADQPGFPDGMIAADDGTVIVAFYNPEPVPNGIVIAFDLKKQVEVHRWEIPSSPRVTCPLLSGNQLYLTTCTEGMPNHLHEQCPAAGSLFRADSPYSSAESAARFKRV